jgi:hypothetical protein
MAVLLAILPSLNLIAVPSAAAAVSHHLTHSDGAGGHQRPRDCPGHDHLDIKCLQCLAMGGMSLAGAELPPVPAPTAQSIDAAWSPARHRSEPLSILLPISRGPPSFA